MAKRKKLEKKARKAYERAEIAIQEAVRAAAKLEKKTRNKSAKKLANSLKVELASGQGTASPSGPRALDAKPSGSSKPHTQAQGEVDLTPPLPTVTDENAPTAAEFAGSVATSEPHDPTLDTLTVQALRDVARTRGIRNVSRLTKAQLIERLAD